MGGVVKRRRRAMGRSRPPSSPNARGLSEARWWRSFGTRLSHSRLGSWVLGLWRDVDYCTMSIDESNLDPRFACTRCHTEGEGLGRFGVGDDGKLSAAFSYRGRERQSNSLAQALPEPGLLAGMPGVDHTPFAFRNDTLSINIRDYIAASRFRVNEHRLATGGGIGASIRGAAHRCDQGEPLPL